jgi:predicted nucleic acid-binding protein
VRIIVDANIVFSGILNTNGKIADLLINSSSFLDFIAPSFLRSEIHKHYSKLCKISRLSLDEIQEAEFQICKDITFISEEQIKSSTWLAAEKLTFDVDPKDIPYVAMSKHFRCKIWSGDKELMKGLKTKNFSGFIVTEELFKKREAMIKRDKF